MVSVHASQLTNELGPHPSTVSFHHHRLPPMSSGTLQQHHRDINLLIFGDMKEIELFFNIINPIIHRCTSLAFKSTSVTEQLSDSSSL